MRWSLGHGCDLQVGMGRSPVWVGPGRRMIFQKIIPLYVLPASAFPSFRTFSWSWAPRCGQEAVVTSLGAWAHPCRRQSRPGPQAGEEGRAAARQRLLDLRSHLLSCSNRKLLFMTMLIHRSIHFSLCFTQWFSLNTSCKQRENETKACWLQCLIPSNCTTSSRTPSGFLRL